MDDFILEFEKHYNRAKQKEIELPQAVLAFKLLDAAEVEQKDRPLVLTGVDHSKKTELFDQMKSSLRKLFGEQRCNSGDGFWTVRIKEESVNMASQQPQRWCFNRGCGNFDFHSGQNRFSYKSGSNKTNGQIGARINGSNTGTGTVSSERVPFNPCDVNGNELRCSFCDSVRRFRRDCPHAKEDSKNLLEVENEWKPTLHKEEDVNKVTEYISEEHDVLMCEAANSAVLDSACSKTVTGHIWKEMYLESLSVAEKAQVKFLPGGTIFKFGDETKLCSFEKIVIPCIIAGTKQFIMLLRVTFLYCLAKKI